MKCDDLSGGNTPSWRGSMKHVKVVGILFVLFALSACSAFAPQPTATPEPTKTPVPTKTFTPEPTSTETPTPQPSKTPVPPTATAEDLVLPLPEGEPLAEWQGIPIMPGAITGKEEPYLYTFVIEASPDEVRVYYEGELAKQGYDLMATGTNDAGETKMLMFSGGSGPLSMFFYPYEDGSLMVSLVSK
jgi:hypothetical protein